MANPMLAELDERLSELKSTLAIMAKYAPAPGVLGAPTMEMGLGWKAKALLPKIEAAHATLADMAKRLEAAERDAARYRWLRVAKFDEAMRALFAEETRTVRNAEKMLDAAIDATQEGQAG